MTAEAADEVWIYAGIRWSAADGKLYHEYVDAGGTARWYKRNVGTTVIGGRYKLPVERDGEHVSVHLRRATFIDVVDDREQLVRWKTRHEAERTLADARRKERATKNVLLSMTLEELREEIRRLPTPQRRALLAVVLDLLI